MASARFALEDQVFTITLDRDEKRNAFDRQLSDTVMGGIENARRDAARAIVIRANSDATVWCSGYDLTEIDPAAIARGSEAAPMFQLFERITNCPIPVIAMVSGEVIGGGLLLVVHCDLAIASQNVTLRMPSAHYALPMHPSVYNWCVQTMGVHQAKELFFTDQPMTADRGLQIGLFNYVVDHKSIEPFSYELASKIAQGSASGIANAKLQINAITSQLNLSPVALAAINESNKKLISPTGSVSEGRS